jgi:hypothetical protein
MMLLRDLADVPAVFETQQNILDYYLTCQYFISASQYPESIKKLPDEAGVICILSGIGCYPIARIIRRK